jgi:monofunctional biosynthetic peptidoglycan transglycosylase
MPNPSKIKQKSKSRPGRIIRIISWSIVAALGTLLLLIVLLRWINPPFTSFTIREDWVELKMESYNLRSYWVDYDEIPDPMKWAVVAAEDQLFWTHSGFDVQSIQEAWDDHQAGRRTRGASTLSQQVSKNLFLSGSQSFIRKGIEAGITVLIEFIWPKERILEVYLNIAEFGPGIFGIGKASEVFWNTTPDRINSDRAARLAAVLPSPKRMRVEPPSPYTAQRSRWILRQMRQLTGQSFGAPPQQSTENSTLPDTNSTIRPIDSLITVQPLPEIQTQDLNSSPSDTSTGQN